MKITLEFEHPWELTNLLKELSKQMKEDQAIQDETIKLNELKQLVTEAVYNCHA